MCLVLKQGEAGRLHWGGVGKLDGQGTLNGQGTLGRRSVDVPPFHRLQGRVSVVNPADWVDFVPDVLALIPTANVASDD